MAKVRYQLSATQVAELKSILPKDIEAGSVLTKIAEHFKQSPGSAITVTKLTLEFNEEEMSELAKESWAVADFFSRIYPATHGDDFPVAAKVDSPRSTGSSADGGWGPMRGFSSGDEDVSTAAGSQGLQGSATLDAVAPSDARGGDSPGEAKDITLKESALNRLFNTIESGIKSPYFYIPASIFLTVITLAYAARSDCKEGILPPAICNLADIVIEALSKVLDNFAVTSSKCQENVNACVPW